MTFALLLLGLCVVTSIQLTSSQSTYDVIPQESDVTSCGRTEEVLHQLTAAVIQLQRTVSQLHSDVAEVKAWKTQRTVAGWSWTTFIGFYALACVTMNVQNEPLLPVLQQCFVSEINCIPAARSG